MNCKRCHDLVERGALLGGSVESGASSTGRVDVCCICFGPIGGDFLAVGRSFGYSCGRYGSDVGGDSIGGRLVGGGVAATGGDDTGFEGAARNCG